MADGTGNLEHLVDEMLNEAQLEMDWAAALHSVSQRLDLLTAHAAVSPGFEGDLRAVLSEAQHNLNQAAFERLDRIEGDES